jgi:hypothetical protein
MPHPDQCISDAVRQPVPGTITMNENAKPNFVAGMAHSYVTVRHPSAITSDHMKT